ncbi:MAG: phosphate signaling complex protein PhoU [Desulfobacterales bacterium]|jgi:phosphate transport system protein|nr:phosphate signaling complex protein PhoU [Desulfobacteraceae bacterium]MDD3990886.1 phosphate signaling complex protein PhoU [Desulfobacteraceae bacterium]MDY0312442.1 phosphate signaling complex protein PhoU [Desulfobacterales bacterium]
MGRHLQKELDNIKKRILSLGALVEDRVRMASQAIEQTDQALAAKIVETDWEIDEAEVEIEEECLKILALHQPVAVDLRFLVAVIKINNDLERIADEAMNIAERVISIAKREDPGFRFDYVGMASKSENMLKKSLDSLVNLDVDLAFKVVVCDDEVDAMHRDAYQRTCREMGRRPEAIKYLLNYYLISRHLERIADHATNIAEEVIYLVEGEIVRHGKF